jgi:phosphoribosyl-ATP pyrophosphohydrolase/phosphoribosyl-AMP cyclohydrolase
VIDRAGQAAPLPLDPADIRYGPGGLVPAIAQDASDGRVLMVAWQDAEAIEATLRTGFAHFHSRSRDRLWMKGEESGNRLAVTRFALDCDRDTVLLTVRPSGPTCHTGARSCFDGGPATALADGAPVSTSEATDTGARRPRPSGLAWLDVLWSTIEERARTRPPGSYTARLLDAGVDGPARKVAEEAIEVLIAAKDDAVQEATETGRDRAPLAGEVADLLYHALVLCAERGLAPATVVDVLRARHEGRGTDAPAGTQEA